MEAKLKALIKEAILEALVEFTNGGIATTSGGDAMEDGIGSGHDSGGTGNNTGNNTGGNSGQGGGSEESSGGGTFGDGRPKPNVGVGVWSMRP